MPTYGSEFRTLLPREFPLIDSLNISLTDEKKRKKILVSRFAFCFIGEVLYYWFTEKVLQSVLSG